MTSTSQVIKAGVAGSKMRLKNPSDSLCTHLLGGLSGDWSDLIRAVFLLWCALSSFCLLISSMPAANTSMIAFVLFFPACFSLSGTSSWASDFTSVFIFTSLDASVETALVAESSGTNESSNVSWPSSVWLLRSVWWSAGVWKRHNLSVNLCTVTCNSLVNVEPLWFSNKISEITPYRHWEVNKQNLYS